MPSDLRENVRNVGFVEYGKSKTLSAEVFERRADKIKFLAVDDQETVVERHSRKFAHSAAARLRPVRFVQMASAQIHQVAIALKHY